MMRNSLVAGNNASLYPDVAGKLISDGYNLIQNTSSITFLDPGHKHHTDFAEMPLAGLHIDAELLQSGERILALLSGSPAIDAIPLEECRIEGITTDQRGVRRPQGPACDIGAYEYEHES
jgi:hypothetical protein